MAQEEREVIPPGLNISLKFNATGQQRIEKIQERMESSIPQVMREALQVYEALTAALEGGAEVMIHWPDGRTEHVFIEEAEDDTVLMNNGTDT